MKKAYLISKIAILILSICGIGLFILYNSAYANDVPTSPSDVSIDGNNNLIVQKPQGVPRPFVIKGISWSPATKAPAEGSSPLNPLETTQYGFFFDWTGRNPQGHEVLNYWLKNQLETNYAADIPLIKGININTVRIYNSLGSNVEDYAQVKNQLIPLLDEFYRNGIMVIMSVANSRDDLDERFYVYSDRDSALNHFIPSGWMGDYGDLSFDDTAANPHSGKSCIKITYTANKSQGQGWAGIYWQEPANNWGDIPNAGYNLTGARKVTFWARGENGGEFVDVFKAGGITGPYGDSDSASLGSVVLTNDWKKYTIDLTGKNLSHIIGGFSFAFAPPAKTFYLDDIRYEGYEIALQNGERRYETVVESFKNHPAILMWAVGNEWNFNRLYDDASTLDDASLAVETAAQRIKTIDSHHPVSSILGDKFEDAAPVGGCPPSWKIRDVLQRCPGIDIWGLNVYRGNSFGLLFDQWKEQWILINQPPKPFFISEFGTDSFYSAAYTADGTCSVRADSVTGYEDEQRQSDFVLGLWDEIKIHLSAPYSTELCTGGVIFEFNDALWKVGNYNIGLGGLVDYNNPPDNHSFDDYNSEGFVVYGGSPDGVLNEEYFGLVKDNRLPKVAYGTMKEAFQDPNMEPIGPKTTQEGVLLQFVVRASDLNGDTLTYSASPLPYGASFNALTQTFSWTPDYNQAGTYNITFTVTDGESSDTEIVAITVTEVLAQIISLSDSPDPFSPNGDGVRETTAISGKFNHICNWNIDIKNLAASIVRTFSGTGTSVSVIWDGKNNLGIRVPDGIYTYILRGTDIGASSASKSGTARIDTTAPVISNLTDSPDPFRPSIGQTTIISFTISEPSYATLRIYNSSGSLVRTLLSGSYRTTLNNSVVWNGKNGSGILVSSGVYTYMLWVWDPAQNKASPYPAKGTVTVQ